MNDDKFEKSPLHKSLDGFAEQKTMRPLRESTLYEYLVRQRTSRATSGHEAEELEAYLNGYAEAGWALHSIIENGIDGTQQTVIFEREKK